MATNPGTELSSIDFGSLIGGPLTAIITAQSQAARATADFIKTVGFDGDNKPVYVDFKYPKEVQPYQPAVPQGLSITIGADSAANDNSGYIDPPAVTFSPTGATANAIVQNGKVVRIEVVNGGTYTSSPTVTIAPSPAGSTHGATATADIIPAVPAVPAVYQEMKFEVPILTMLPIPFIKVDLATIDFNAKINSMETASASSDFAISGNLEVQQRWPGGAAKLNVACSYKKSTASGSSVERTYSMQIHVQASQDDMPAGMEKLLNLLESAMKSTPVDDPV